LEEVRYPFYTAFPSKILQKEFLVFQLDVMKLNAFSLVVTFQIFEL
jgi:hypothetical protein